MNQGLPRPIARLGQPGLGDEISSHGIHEQPIDVLDDGASANPKMRFGVDRDATTAREELALDVAAMRALGVLAWRRPQGEIVLGPPPPPPAKPREEISPEERRRLEQERADDERFAATPFRPRRPA